MLLPNLSDDMEYYQDTWIKGKVVKKGVRECSLRYEIIKKQLEKLKEDFTVLDVGSNMGYFGFRIAEDFPKSEVILLEDNESYVQYTKELMELNKYKNVRLVRGKYHPNIFGYVNPHMIICLSTLHWMVEDYAAVLDSMTNVCPVILEIPTEEEIKVGPWISIQRHLINQEHFFKRWNSKVIGKSKSHLVEMDRNIYWVDRWNNLNLGSGDVMIEDYCNVDLHETTHTHIRDDVRTLARFRDNILKKLYASHVLLYIHPTEVITTLKTWHRVLVYGGDLVIENPVTREPWEVYKNLMGIDVMTKLMKESGFRDIEEISIPRYSKYWSKNSERVGEWLKTKQGDRPDIGSYAIRGIK